MRIIVFLLVFALTAHTAPSQRGPRKVGIKRQVDKKAVVRPPDPRFFRGPRGACYTLSAGGAKRYVDRSHCR
jgi:hypothetical protein